MGIITKTILITVVVVATLFVVGSVLVVGTATTYSLNTCDERQSQMTAQQYKECKNVADAFGIKK